MTCPLCGTSVPEGARYCAECGTDVADAAPDLSTSGSVATPLSSGSVLRNLMVNVPSREAILQSLPLPDAKGNRYPPIDVRADWSPNPVYGDLPLGKLYWQVDGLVFLSKGERGLWPSLRGPLLDFTEEQLLHHLYGILGLFFKDSLPRSDDDAAEEDWIEEALANPATVVIPAPLIVSAKLERLNSRTGAPMAKGRTFARVTTDDGKVFSFAPADPFYDLSHASEKGAFFSNIPMAMRMRYEIFYFYATLLYAAFEDVQLVVDALKKYYGPNVGDLNKLNPRLAEKGLTSAALITEARYHTQRFGEYFKDRPDLFPLNLQSNYVPWCFRCGIKALRPLAKYCTSCGLWMW